MEMEIDRVVDWLELENDMIEFIITRLTVLVDFIRFGAVCKTWRSIFLENRHCLPHQLPILIIPSDDDENQEFRGFFNLSEKQTYRLKKLPGEDNDKCCYGSSEGCLIMVDLHLNISLLNPFCRTETPLPRLTTLFRIIDAIETDAGTIEYRYEFPGDLLRIETAEYVREMLVHKIITAGPYVVAILALGFNLAFCRRDGNAWTFVEGNWLHLQDVVCYNGNFYAVNAYGRVVVLDLSGCHPTVMEVAMMTGGGDEFSTKYLVEFSGQLLMVARRFDDMPRTTSFEIFRVDVNKHLVVPLKSLGDGMLFLGENCSMSLSARDFSGCEGNRIYFTQEWYFREPPGGHDIGVYNVEDGSIEPHCKMDLKRLWPRPVWLTPKPW